MTQAVHDADGRGDRSKTGRTYDLELAVPDAAAGASLLMGLSGRVAGRLFPLSDGEIFIGRASSAHVRIDENAVSTRHAKIMREGAHHVVEDLGSTNGTFVNEQRVLEPTALRAGDVVRVGKTLLGYLSNADDGAERTRALARVDFGSPVAHTGDHGSSVVDVSPVDRLVDRLQIGWGFVARYWRLLALVGLACALLGGLTSVLRPPKSTAEFEIFLRHDASQTPVQNFTTRGIDFFISAERNFEHPEVVRTTLQAMGNDDPTTAEVRAAAGALHFEGVAHSTYRGTFEHLDPEYAEAFLAEHVQQYLEWEIGKALEVIRSEVDLLQKQLTENEKELEATEQELEAFKTANIDGLPDQAASQLGAKVALLTRRDELAADLERYSAELQLSRRQLASEDAIVERKVQKSQPYEDALADVRRKIAEARSEGLADGHPRMRALASEERELQALSRRTVTSETTEIERRANPEHKRLENRAGELAVAVQATRKELGLVSARLASIDRVARDLPQVEARYSELSRKLGESHKLHARLFEQLKAKELQLEFERASVAARYEVMKPPRAEAASQVKATALRAGAGGVGGVGLAVLIAGAHALLVYARRRKGGIVLRRA